MNTNVNVPWVEKYRPTKFENIVLDENNRKLFQNILDKKYFPNLLFYGPPGTGKTTTIINLISEYQIKNSVPSKSQVIHLNASDERGIDIIRNQINQFVKSLSLFDSGLKFVILDEVDYMTKNAQQALKYLLQTCVYNVRFCLICNYISKIDESLQNEFICIRFNQLPKRDIQSFIRSICEKERIWLNDGNIDTIQNMFNSDIRSMINFIQLNQNLNDWHTNIVNDDVWETLHVMLTLNDLACDHAEIIKHIHSISNQYNIDKKNIIQKYFNYVVRNKPEIVNSEYLNIIKKMIHNPDLQTDHLLTYFVYSMKRVYKRD
jgi:DNA polymerase III delta prime subunit